MGLRQTLYKIKQRVEYKTTTKLNVAEDKRIILVMDCDSKPFATLFPRHIIASTVYSLSKSDLEKVEVVFGAPDKRLLKSMTSLKWLQLSSAGTNGYDDRSLYSTDVRVTTAKGIYGLPIAECVVGSILFLTKAALSNTVHTKYRIAPFSGKDFTASNIIICGLGDIGRNIALRCKGMQCGKIIGFDKVLDPIDNVDEIYSLEQLEEHISQADIVISALPEVPETIGLFNKKIFDQMRKGSVFVNVGRGSAVVQKDLDISVREGHLYGAALDATTPDPLPPHHFLRKNRRILLTNHLSCISQKNYERLCDFYLQQAAKYIAGDLK